MERAQVLARLNNGMMEAFSRRTIAALRTIAPIRFVLPPFEPLLAANVAKEIEKDRIVIARAALLLASGATPAMEQAEELFEETRLIDRAFLEQITPLPITLEIDYRQIHPVRVQRIERLLSAVHRLLATWETTLRLRVVIQTLYSQPALAQLLEQLLHLYAQETRLLSRSVQLPRLLAPARDMFADVLFKTMTETGAQLSRELAGIVFRRPGGG